VAQFPDHRPRLPLIDGRWLGRLLPIHIPELTALHPVHKSLLVSAALLVVLLSIQPIRNMLSPRQIMNTSFNAYHLVGTYGLSEASPACVTKWSSKEPAKPRPTLPPSGANTNSKASPAMSPACPRRSRRISAPRLADVVRGHGHVRRPSVVPALRREAARRRRRHTRPAAHQPLSRRPPRWVRAELYQYDFTTPDEHRRTGHWWRREPVGIWFPPATSRQGSQ